MSWCAGIVYTRQYTAYHCAMAGRDTVSVPVCCSVSGVLQGVQECQTAVEVGLDVNIYWRIIYLGMGNVCVLKQWKHVHRGNVSLLLGQWKQAHSIVSLCTGAMYVFR